MTKPHDYHRFSGWRLIALIVVFAVYTGWFVSVGPFGELTRIEGYNALQERGFYTGAEALAAIERLDETQRGIKFKALGFDLIYMVLQALVFEALMAFGLRHLGWMKRRWRYVLLLPMGFLVFDFLEDSFLALLLETEAQWIGSAAGIFTALKFATFIPCVLIALGLTIAGSVTYLIRR